MEQQEYDDLVRRFVAVSERQETMLQKIDDRQADMQSPLASLNTKYPLMDVSLTFIDEAMGKQTTILEQQQTLLTELKTIAQHHATLLDRLTLVLDRHEATCERLGRLLDERLPPPSGNGRTEDQGMPRQPTGRPRGRPPGSGPGVGDEAPRPTVRGKLCPRSHDYQGTGQRLRSLPRATKGGCVACDAD